MTTYHSFNAFAQDINAMIVSANSSWKPVILTLSSGDEKAFDELCHRHNLQVYDFIDRQLEELAIFRFPSSDDTSARSRFVDKTLETVSDSKLVGNWVFYPWDMKFVHVLNATDFFDVITSRNQHKIMRDEQELLRSKCVGVIGLSVGGEAATTVAQEHLCGRILLADFDRLDLSNLNRLNAGVDELGVNKAIISARRIAKIDPYIEIEIFEEGVTESNLTAFLEPLDLLLEECDSLALKYSIRERAKRARLNVIYAADERGFYSVEPYAHRPDAPLFHGLIDKPYLPREAYSSSFEFMMALTEWLGGWSAISERSRESLEQIGKTVSGYPQLASEARFAAGQVGHIARRLLLGERLEPQWGQIDLENIYSVPSA